MVFTDYLWAFLIGGGLCAIGQIFIDLTGLTPARILTAYVVSGVVLSALGIYKPLSEIGGEGAAVPLTGFGHLLAQEVEKAVDEQGFLGVLTGGFTGASAGIAAALMAGLLAAVVFRQRDK